MDENASAAEKLIEQWAQDSKIDESELGAESLRVEQLHDKYQKLLARAKRELRVRESTLAQLRLEKFQHYTQGPSRESLAKGWRLPPSGKVLKNEAWQYVDADPDVVKLAIAAGEAQDAVTAVFEKVKMIAFRGNRISDAIKWQLFIHGK